MQSSDGGLDSPDAHLYVHEMSAVTIDTLKLARRLEAAGFPPKQAADTAEALGDALGETVVTRDYLDAKLSEQKSDVLKSIMAMLLGAVTVNTAVVIGAMFGLAKLLGH